MNVSGSPVILLHTGPTRVGCQCFAWISCSCAKHTGVPWEKNQPSGGNVHFWGVADAGFHHVPSAQFGWVHWRIKEFNPVLHPCFPSGSPVSEGGSALPMVLEVSEPAAQWEWQHLHCQRAKVTNNLLSTGRKKMSPLFRSWTGTQDH